MLSLKQQIFGPSPVSGTMLGVWVTILSRAQSLAIRVLHLEEKHAHIETISVQSDKGYDGLNAQVYELPEDRH